MFSRVTPSGMLLSRSPFLSPNKRLSVLEEKQGEMGYEESPVKAPPNTRRRIMPRHSKLRFLRRTNVSGKRIRKRNGASGAVRKEG